MKKKGLLVIIGIVIIALLVALFALSRPTSMEKIMKKNDIALTGKYAVLDIGKTTTTLDDIEFVKVEKKGGTYKDMIKAIKKADLKKVKKSTTIDVRKGTVMLNIKESEDASMGIRFYVNSDNEVQFDTKLYKVNNDVELYDAIEKAYKKSVIVHKPSVNQKK